MYLHRWSIAQKLNKCNRCKNKIYFYTLFVLLGLCGKWKKNIVTILSELKHIDSEKQRTQIGAVRFVLLRYVS